MVERKQEWLTVDGYTHEIADFLDFATSETNGSEVPEDKVVVGAASLEPVAVL